VAAVSPRAVRDNPEPVPHGWRCAGLVCRYVLCGRETEYSAGLNCFLASFPVLARPRLTGFEIGKRGAAPR
jgi:hypothetical protein